MTGRLQPFREKAETAPGEGELATVAFAGARAGLAMGAAAGAVLLSFTYSQAPTQASSGARGRPAQCT